MDKYVIDAHCDALLKLWEKEKENYATSPYIETNLERLQRGNVRVQFFAIFVEPWIKQDQKFSVVLEQVRLFHEKVIKENPTMRHIKNWSELMTLKDGEIAAILTLEGVDAIGDDLTKLNILYELGVLSVGLTWNEANLCADGVGEPRGAGLTLLGNEVVRLNNDHRVLTDVSHLSEKGFWDVIDVAKYPVATHSNARSLCDHRRNLDDDQIKALVDKKGWIGIVFYPLFLTNGEEAAIDDILKQIDYFCSLGAENHIGIGSDFDGISHHVKSLEHSGQFHHLINELEKRYSSQIVKKFLNGNMMKMLKRISD